MNNINDKSNFPLGDNGKSAFGLPLDYFASFEDKLKKRIELEMELTEFLFLSSLKKENAFVAPENYFQSVQNSLEYQAEISGYPKLGSVKKQLFNDWEESYKKQFETSLMLKVELADELFSYPTLYAIDKVNLFSTPASYFETFTERVKDKIYSKKPSNAFSISTVLDLIFGKKMAFAFGIVFILSLAFYFNQSSEKVIEFTDCKTLACLEKQEILNTKIILNFDEDELIDLVDVNSLNKQLKLKEQKSDSSAVNEDVLNNVSTDDLLDDL